MVNEIHRLRVLTFDKDIKNIKTERKCDTVKNIDDEKDVKEYVHIQENKGREPKNGETISDHSKTNTDKHVTIDKLDQFIPKLFKPQNNPSSGIFRTALCDNKKETKRHYHKGFSFHNIKSTLSPSKIKETIKKLNRDKSLFPTREMKRNFKRERRKRLNKSVDTEFLHSCEKSNFKRKPTIHRTLKCIRSLYDIVGSRRSKCLVNALVNQKSSSYYYCELQREKGENTCTHFKHMTTPKPSTSKLTVRKIRSCESALRLKSPFHGVHLIDFPRSQNISDTRLRTNSKSKQTNLEQYYKTETNRRKSTMNKSSAKVNFKHVGHPTDRGDVVCGPDCSAQTTELLKKASSYQGDVNKCVDSHKSQVNLESICKSLLLVLAVIVWTPCILTMILCWIITYPLRPTAENTRFKRRKNQPPRKFRKLCSDLWSSFLTWYEKEVKAGPASLIQRNKHRRKHSRPGKRIPDPTKKYILSHCDERGWVIKPAKPQCMDYCKKSQNTNYTPCGLYKKPCLKKYKNVCPQIIGQQDLVFEHKTPKKSANCTHRRTYPLQAFRKCSQYQDYCKRREPFNRKFPKRTKQINKKIPCSKTTEYPVPCLPKQGKCLSCIQRLTKLEKQAWDPEVNCGDIYIRSLKHRPWFWIHDCCRSGYPCFLVWHRFSKNCCHFILLVCSTCVWFPPLLCCYLCMMIFCRCNS